MPPKSLVHQIAAAGTSSLLRQRMDGSAAHARSSSSPASLSGSAFSAGRRAAARPAGVAQLKDDAPAAAAVAAVP